jgi:hypothetical protein
MYIKGKIVRKISNAAVVIKKGQKNDYVCSRWRRITSYAFLLPINTGNGIWSGWTAPLRFNDFDRQLSFNWIWNWQMVPI